jgi:hypothetical protein
MNTAGLLVQSSDVRANSRNDAPHLNRIPTRDP